jgi:hypothetical protein
MLIAAIYARKSTDQHLPDAEKSVTRQVEHATVFLPFNPSRWSEDGLRPVSASRLGPRKAETTSR